MQENQDTTQAGTGDKRSTPTAHAESREPGLSDSSKSPPSVLTIEPEPDTDRGLTPMATLIASKWKSEDHPALVRFREWLEQWRLRGPDVALLGDGRRRAEARRTFLEGIIAQDPDRVLAAAVPWHLRNSLPAEVVALLEVRVDGMGDLQRMAVTPVPGRSVAEPEWMEATVNSRSYRVYSSSQERQRSLGRAYLHGVAFDTKLAVTGSPVRAAEAGEPVGQARPLLDVCPVSGRVTPAAPPEVLTTNQEPAPPPNVLDAGENYIRVCTPAHNGTVEEQLAAAEKNASPWIEQNAASGTAGTAAFFANQPSLSWSTGTKQCLIIRVDFSDLAGAPLSETEVSDTFNDSANGVRAYYEQGSFSATSVQLAPAVSGDSPAVTQVFRLPQTAEYYATGYQNGELHTAARTAATNAGYDVASFDRIGVVFNWLGDIPGSQITYGGLGNIEGKNFWINGPNSFDLRVVSHEIGHNYGLPHASRQRVLAGSSAVANDGTWEEYGDLTDNMGISGSMGRHFNMWSKAWLHWLGMNGAQVVSADGTYRIWRFDHQNSNPNSALQPLALRIARRDDEEYWIGHRRALTTNADAMNGAYIIWGYDHYQNTRVIDCRTPSDTNANDAPLPVGQSIYDSEAGIRITTVARGGAGGTDEWLDVQVQFTPRLETGNVVTYLDEQAGPGRVLLRSANPVNGPVSAFWNTINGTALAGTDYTASGGALTWTAGDNLPKLLNIPLNADAIHDNDEDFDINLTGVTGAAFFSAAFPAEVRIRQPGANDPAFTRGSFLNSLVYATTQDEQGRVIIGGSFDLFGGLDLNGVARFLPDGTEDTSFSPTQIDNTSSIVYAVAAQPDGKIVCGGNFVPTAAPARLIRLNEDGSTDTSFAIGTGPNNTVRAVVRQSDGKLLVGGTFTSFNGTACRGVVRLNADGSLDSSFTNPVFYNAYTTSIYSIALQPDGKIIIAGQFLASSSSPSGCSVARLNTNGSTDTSFNVGYGAHSTFSISSASFVYSVAALSNGKVALGGIFQRFNGSFKDRFVVLSSTGEVDNSYVTQGFDSDVNCLLALPNGRLLVGGNFTQTTDAIPTTTNQLALFRADGTLDTSFNASHPVRDEVNAFYFDTESGRILTGGWFTDVEPAFSTQVYKLFSGVAGIGPVITQQPVAATITQGSTYTLSIQARAAAPYCQWYKDSVLIPGARNLSYTIPSAGAADSGSYYAVIVNAHGTVTSTSVAVNVNLLPVITQQPADLIVNAGQSAAFSITVTSSTSTPTYQWLKGGVEIPGANLVTYFIPVTTTDSAGSYSCAVTNATGTIYSDAAILAVVTPPMITSHPANLTVIAPADATLAVSASGLFLSYQWQRNTVDLPGQTAATLTLTNTTIYNSGSYRCVVTNQAGSATSNAAMLNVDAPPGIERQPVHQTVNLGQSVTLDLEALGPGLSYQWQKEEADIPGATAASHIINPTTLLSAGSYRCRITNYLGFVISNTAILTIISPPVITAPALPATVISNLGQSYVFTVTATGPALSYQWRKNGMDIHAAQQTSLTLPSITGGNAGEYVCRVFNTAGEAFSPVFTLQVIEPPVIDVQPVNVTVDAGQPATFQITVTGIQLTYQWMRNTVPIAGATAASYTINAVTGTQVGSYTCQVANSAGSVLSAKALLAITGMPVITREPFSVIAEAGAPVEMSLEASGENLAFAWKKNTTTISTQRVWAPGLMTSALVSQYVAQVSNALNTISAPPAYISLTTVLGPAVEAPNIKWSTTGHGFWLPGTASQSHDGIDMLVTSPIIHSQKALLTTRMTGPLTLRWWQKLSTEAGKDIFRVTVDGVESYTASGEIDWQPVSLFIADGAHLVEFSYAKDDSGSAGQDRVWIDNIIPGPTYDVTGGGGHHLLPTGSDLTLNVAVTGVGAPDVFQWRRNATNISGAKSQQLMLSALTTAKAGTYDCAITETVNGAKTVFAGDPIQVGIVSVTDKTYMIKASTRTTFTATAAGNGLSYQWRKQTALGTTVLAGQTSSTFILTSPQPTDSGDYICQVSSLGGQIDAGINEVFIFNAAPIITHTGDLPPSILSGPYDYPVPYNPDPAFTPTAFTISGQPAGLVIDKVTGRITGTPNVSRAEPYEVTITAANSVNKATLKTRITVLGLGNKTGLFVGMLPRQPALNENLGGRFDLNVTATGAFTGSLTLALNKYSFSGRLVTAVNLPAQATANVQVLRGKLTPLTLQFTLTDGELLTNGSVTSGAEALSFTGWRNPWTSKDPANVFMGISAPPGLYTFGLKLPAPLIGVATTPQGTGYGSFTLNKTTGMTTIAGRLADDTAYTAAASMGRQGQLILFTTLYSAAARGSIVGQPKINLTLTQENHTLTGSVSWLLPPLAKPRIYEDGMTQPIDLTVEGGRYISPVAPDLVLGLVNGGANAATLAFTHGGIGLPPPLPDLAITLGVGNSVNYPVSNQRNTSLSFVTDKGAVTGTFSLEDNDPLDLRPPPTVLRKLTRKVTYQGLLIRGATGWKGVGYFMLPKLPAVTGETISNTDVLSGNVLLQPTPVP